MTDAQIKQIKEKADTFEVIQRFSSVNLKKKGVNYIAPCPFHEEKTASFVVSPQKNRYKCFGCGASGKAIDFLMQYNNDDFITVAKQLANFYNIDIAENTDSYKLKIINEKIATEKKLTAEELEIIQKESAKKIEKQLYFLKQNTNKIEVQKYLEKIRNIDVSIIPQSFYYQSNAYEFDGKKFPISLAFVDSSETLINKRFIGKLPEGIQKSRNSGTMNNKVYDKTFRPKEAAVYVTEGVINALSLYQLEQSAISLFASSNTFTEVHKLIKYFKNKTVNLAFDNDRAGLKFAVNFSKFLFGNEKIIQFKSINLVLFPESQDANDLLIANTLEQFLENDYNFIQLSSSMIAEKHAQQKRAIQEREKSYIPVFEQKKLYNLTSKTKKAIRTNNSCVITTKIKVTYEQENTVAFSLDAPEELMKLRNYTNNLIFHNFNLIQLNDIYGNEDGIITACKLLTTNGFNLMIEQVDMDYENGGYSDTLENVSFIEYYTQLLHASIPIGNSKARTLAIERAAEFLAKLDVTEYTVHYTETYKRFGLNKSDWNAIAKKYLDKESNQRTYNFIKDEIDQNKANIAELVDPNNLPSYVDINDFHAKGYYAAQNSYGKEVLYMFKNKESGIMVASNFTMKMIGHLFHYESAKNKRIIKITDEIGREHYLEMPSSVIRSFNDFSLRIYDAANLFFHGTKRQYEMLLKDVSTNIPQWLELEILGQNQNDFFAFADGIYDYRKKKFLDIDELGIVSYGEHTYYIPVFSSIFKKMNMSSDRHESARNLRFHKAESKGHDFNHTDFATWTQLMTSVYKEDSAGMFSIIFVIMSAFRDFIYKQHRRFPLMFLSGPTNSGKSQVAESIQAPFASGMHSYNLNSGTDAAFFVNLEKYKNIAMIFEEYNDTNISPTKFQGLKAGYDGIGKQKKKDVSSKDLDVSEVNCSIMYLGQEIPEQDDYALFNRSISFFIPQKDFTKEESRVYDDLKAREEKGLTNIIVEILNKRDLIEKHYYKRQLIIKDELKRELTEEGARFQERILNSVSEALTIAYIFENYATDLPLTFTYDQIRQAGKEKIMRLSEMVQSANRLAIFFQTITYLFNQGKIISGREFKIEERTTVKIRLGQNKTKDIIFDKPKKLIFIRTNLIFPMYRDIQRNEALKTSLLSTYIKDAQAHVGAAINEDFEWYERRIVEVEADDGHLYKKDDIVSSKVRNTSAIVLEYDLLELDLERITNDNLSKEKEPEPVDYADEMKDDSLPF